MQYFSTVICLLQYHSKIPLYYQQFSRSIQSYNSIRFGRYYPVGSASQYISGNNTIMSVLIRNYLKTRNNDKNYMCRFQTRCVVQPIQLG